jgi:hypothetical protein
MFGGSALDGSVAQTHRSVMDEQHQKYAYERYLDQRAAHYGVYRDDLPYSPNLDLVRVQVNLQFGTDYSHSEIYQAISHLARSPDKKLIELGLRREGDVPFRGGAH